MIGFPVLGGGDVCMYIHRLDVRRPCPLIITLDVLVSIPGRPAHHGWPEDEVHPLTLLTHSPTSSPGRGCKSVTRWEVAGDQPAPAQAQPCLAAGMGIPGRPCGLAFFAGAYIHDTDLRST